MWNVWRFFFQMLTDANPWYFVFTLHRINLYSIFRFWNRFFSKKSSIFWPFYANIFAIRPFLVLHHFIQNMQNLIFYSLYFIKNSRISLRLRAKLHFWAEFCQKIHFSGLCRPTAPLFVNGFSKLFFINLPMTFLFRLARGTPPSAAPFGRDAQSDRNFSCSKVIFLEYCDFRLEI